MKYDISPLVAEVVRELSELTAASAKFDDEVVKARSAALAYGKLVRHIYPWLSVLCEKVNVGSPSSRIQCIMYRLDRATSFKPLHIDVIVVTSWVRS
jgi:hypothetical protein